MIEEMVKDFKQIKYDSLNEFYNYICDTPINETFRWEKHESVDGSKIFTKTESCSGFLSNSVVTNITHAFLLFNVK